MVQRLLLAGLLSTAAVALDAAAQPPALPPDLPTVTITPPQGGTDGKLVIVYPKAKLLEEVRNAIPAEVALPDQKLGNQLIYHDVELNKVKAAGVKPASLALDKNVFTVAGTPTVNGDLNCKYEHIVVKPGLPPKVERDWRPKGATPFEIKIEVRGKCEVSFTGGDVLKDGRLRLETKADLVRITSVKLDTGDLALKALEAVIGVVGREFPNELLNKPIKDGLTRKFEVDPFRTVPAKDREGLDRYKVKDVKVDAAADKVTVTAALTPRP
jgi:hypothetical protein